MRGFQKRLLALFCVQFLRFSIAYNIEYVSPAWNKFKSETYFSHFVNYVDSAWNCTTDCDAGIKAATLYPFLVIQVLRFIGLIITRILANMVKDPNYHVYGSVNVIFEVLIIKWYF